MTLIYENDIYNLKTELKKRCLKSRIGLQSGYPVKK